MLALPYKVLSLGNRGVRCALQREGPLFPVLAVILSPCLAAPASLRRQAGAIKGAKVWRPLSLSGLVGQGKPPPGRPVQHARSPNLVPRALSDVRRAAENV